MLDAQSPQSKVNAVTTMVRVSANISSGMVVLTLLLDLGWDGETGGHEGEESGGSELHI